MVGAKFERRFLYLGYSASDLVRYAPASGPVGVFLWPAGRYCALLDLHEHILTSLRRASRISPSVRLPGRSNVLPDRTRSSFLVTLSEEDVVQPMAENPRIPFEETLPVEFETPSASSFFLELGQAARFATTA